MVESRASNAQDMCMHSVWLLVPIQLQVILIVRIQLSEIEEKLLCAAGQFNFLPKSK